MKKLIVLCTILLISGVFSVLSGIHPYLGTVSLSIGIVVSIYSLVRSYLQNRELNDFLEAQNIINMKNHSGNLYYEAFKKKMQGNLMKRGFNRVDSKLLEKAYLSNPSDEETLLTYSAVKVLKIELDNYVTGKTDKYSLKTIKHNLKILVKKGIELGKVYSILGIIADLEGNHKAARNNFIKSGEFNEPLWRFHLATSYQFTSQFKESLDILIEELENGNSNWLTYLALGRTYSRLFDYEKSLMYFKKAYKLRGNRIELLEHLATCNLKLAHLYRSNYFQFKFSTVLILSGYKRGVFLFFVSGFIFVADIFQAISRLIWVVTNWIPIINIIHVRIFSPVTNYFQMGTTYLKEKDYKAAIFQFEKCVSVCKKFPAYYEKLACSYAFDHQREKALEMIKRAMQLDKNNIVYSHNYEAIKSSSDLVLKNYANKRIMERMILRYRISHRK